MLELGFTALQGLSIVAALVALAGVGFAFARRWPLARKLASASVLLNVAIFPLAMIVMVYGFSLVANADASSKATVLGRTISSGMNCMVPMLPSFIAAAVVWSMARKRMPARN